jgi:hypothetical protein
MGAPVNAPGQKGFCGEKRGVFGAQKLCAAIVTTKVTIVAV